MDMARLYQPDNILLWRNVADHPEAQRILTLFPDAQVEVIEKQKLSASSIHSVSEFMLPNKKVLMIGETQSFVNHFSGGLGSSVHCCPYYKLVPVSNGCPYSCSYCYLAYIYCTHSPFIKINLNTDTMVKQIRKALTNTNRRIHFNMGEMLDSLALDHITHLIPMVIPFFEDFPYAYLMLLTKSANIKNLLTVPPHPQVVLSWSLNSQTMIDSHEHGTASLAERIDAARTCQHYGYRIRYRIDPGILYPDWKAGYAQLIEQALTDTQPENITLGMLRLLPGHIPFIQKTYPNHDFSKKILTEKASDGKLRFPALRRIEFYRFLIDTIRSFDSQVSISLCRETPPVWQALKSLATPSQCNCLTW